MVTIQINYRDLAIVIEICNFFSKKSDAFHEVISIIKDRKLNLILSAHANKNQLKVKCTNIITVRFFIY